MQSAARCLYGLKTLRAHGLTEKSLWDVTQATLIAKNIYAAPAWWGFLSVAEKNRIESFIKTPSATATYQAILKMYVLLWNVWNLNYSTAFCPIPIIVLYQLLLPEKDIDYNLRQRSHSLTLPSESNNLIRKNFQHRMLFTDIY